MRERQEDLDEHAEADERKRNGEVSDDVRQVDNRAVCWRPRGREMCRDDAKHAEGEKRKRETAPRLWRHRTRAAADVADVLSEEEHGIVAVSAIMRDNSYHHRYTHVHKRNVKIFQ